MNFINCTGNETTIEDCDHRKFDWVSSYIPAGVACIDNGIEYDIELRNNLIVQKFNIFNLVISRI